MLSQPHNTHHQLHNNSMTKPDSSNSSPPRPLVLHDLPPFPHNLSPDASTPPPHQVGERVPTPSSRQDTSPAASLKGLLRQTLASCTSTLALSAAPLAALLVLAPTPPAFADRCAADSISEIRAIGNKGECIFLYLDNNNLRSLPQGIFSGFNNLAWLYLDNNNLRSLPQGIFSGLNNLEYLDLRYNNLSSLPQGIFSGLNNLAWLYLDNNNLSCLPEVPSGVRVNVDLPSCESRIIISKKTIRLNDPINEVPFDTIVRTLGEKVIGGLFTRASKSRPVTDEQKLLEAAEKKVEAVEYEIDKVSLRSEALNILTSGNAIESVQESLDNVLDKYYDEYTVKLSEEPEGGVTVRISSDHPDAFGVTPDTLTFTPENWNQPQEVRVRLAFTAANYIDAAIPSLATLTHTSSAGGESTDVQVGVIGSRPISDHFTDALIAFYPEIQSLVLKGLCGLNPVCGAFLLGNYIGNLIDLPNLIKDTAVEKAIDVLAKGAAEIVVKYETEGMSGVSTYVKDQFSSSTADPTPTASAKPRRAVQSRIRKRRTRTAANTAANSVSFLDRSSDYLFSRHQEINAGGFDLQHALALLGTDFNVPLASLNLARIDASPDEATPSRNFALWGSIDYSKFGDAANDFSLDGQNWTYTVGVDGQLNPSLLAGVALSLGTTRTDYDYIDSAVTGNYDVDLTVVTPYLNWSANDSLDLWASVGYGKGASRFSLDTIGALELSSVDSLNQDDTRQNRDSDFFSFAGGLRWEAFRSDQTQLALKLAGSTTSFLDSDSQEGRIGAELSRDFSFRSGVLSTSMDLAFLLDNDNTSATELVGGLDWAAANNKFTASAVARTLLFTGDRYEWGVGAALNYKAGTRPGEGLALSLQPSFGITDSNLVDLDILASTDDAYLAFHQRQPTARFHAEVAYGFRNGTALLTPYTRLDTTDHSTTYGAGIRYQLDNSLDLDLSASRWNSSSGNNDNRLFLQLRSDL